jgi:hypothetical protein
MVKLRGRAETIRRLDGTLAMCDEALDRQAALIRELGNPDVTEMHYTPGKMDIEMRSKLITIWTECMAEMLDAEGALNLVEFTVQHPEKGPMTLTLQRQLGKSPMQLYAEVVRELKAMKADAERQFAQGAMPSQLTACGLVSADFDDNTITLEVPPNVGQITVGAGIKIKADLSPILEPAPEIEPPISEQPSIL